jgi:hypothetical protein
MHFFVLVTPVLKNYDKKIINFNLSQDYCVSGYNEVYGIRKKKINFFKTTGTSNKVYDFYE